jgi:hypothetical protein
VRRNSVGRSVLVFAASVVAMAACGSTDKAATSAAPEASASPDTSESPADGGYCTQQGVFDFPGPAADHFGSDAVSTAFCDMVDFTFETGFNGTTIRYTVDQGQGVEDYAYLHEYMTPNLQRSFDEQVARSVAGDEEAESYVNSLAFHGLTAGGRVVTFPEGDIVSNHNFWPGEVSLVANHADPENPMLRVDFTATADIQIVLDGVPHTWTPERTVGLTLVHTDNPDRTWLIDAVDSGFKTSAVTPVA